MISTVVVVVVCLVFHLLGFLFIYILDFDTSGFLHINNSNKVRMHFRRPPKNNACQQYIGVGYTSRGDNLKLHLKLYGCNMKIQVIPKGFKQSVVCMMWQ